MNAYLADLLASRPSDLPAVLPGGARLTALAEGVLLVEPAAPVLDLFLSCGIHGNETAPVELVGRVLDSLLKGELTAKARLMIAFGNPGALRSGDRYLDDDLNRLFGKSVDLTGTGPAALRARELERLTADFFAASGHRSKIHYDLHTAIRGSAIEKFAIYPYPHEAPFDLVEVARLAACGIEAVLVQTKPSPTFSYFSRRYGGAHGFTLELGKARPFGDNREIDLSALEAELRRLVAGDMRRHQVAPPRLFTVAREIIKTSEAFKLHLADSVENFTLLEQGTLIAEDGDQQWIVTEAEARIVFPNPKVKPGLRAGLLVVPIHSF